MDRIIASWDPDARPYLSVTLGDPFLEKLVGVAEAFTLKEALDHSVSSSSVAFEQAKAAGVRLARSIPAIFNSYPRPQIVKSYVSATHLPLQMRRRKDTV